MSTSSPRSMRPPPGVPRRPNAPPPSAAAFRLRSRALAAWRGAWPTAARPRHAAPLSGRRARVAAAAIFRRRRTLGAWYSWTRLSRRSRRRRPESSTRRRRTCCNMSGSRLAPRGAGRQHGRGASQVDRSGTIDPAVALPMGPDRYVRCTHCGAQCPLPEDVVTRYRGHNVTRWCDACRHLFDVQIPPREGPEPSD
jgi:hypothetical protein